MGETILGNAFKLGPGGKGSNQAVAAARLGAEVAPHHPARRGRLRRDGAQDLGGGRGAAGGHPGPDSYTGAAYIFIEEATGDNAIIICPGAAATIAPADLDAQAELIAAAAVFVTQLEQPLEAAVRGLEIARANGVTTILNPAPAGRCRDDVLGALRLRDAERDRGRGAYRPAGREPRGRRARRRSALLARGVGAAVITLGARGALLHGRGRRQLVPAITAGPVVETTGAGDAFNGGFATGSPAAWTRPRRSASAAPSPASR